jgi:RNA polymerase sigma-70 factor (ECF subfamily)
MPRNSRPIHCVCTCGEILCTRAGRRYDNVMFFQSNVNREPEHDLPRVIAQAQLGDPSAFDDLYRRYAHQILRFLYVRTHETESAQDLTQEVFMRVLKGIGKFEYRGEKSFLGWLYTIAGNVLIGQARRKRGLQTPLDDNLELADPRGQEPGASAFDRVFLLHAISQLTEDQQQVLTLKFFADLTNQEIATVIGRSEGAVKALQHRAIHSLQQIIERESVDPPAPHSAASTLRA